MNYFLHFIYDFFFTIIFKEILKYFIKNKSLIIKVSLFNNKENVNIIINISK